MPSWPGWMAQTSSSSLPNETSNLAASFAPPPSEGAAGPGGAEGGGDTPLRISSSSSSTSRMATSTGARPAWLFCSRVTLGIIYVLVICLACVVIWQLVARSSERHVVAWAVGGIAVGIAVPLSLHDIHSHLLHYVNPTLQKQYIRILWMVPIYAVESWLALRYQEQRVYLQVMREAYEAFVIYSVVCLFLDFLGPGLDDTLRKREKKFVKMLPPAWCCRPWKSIELPSRTRLLCFQYVFLRSFLAIVSLIAQKVGVFGEGDWHDPKKMYIWSVVILNASQAAAMFALVTLYHELKEELAPLRPFGKLLAIKLVVFFSFYQSIVISALVSAGVITPTLDYDSEEIASGLQNFCICLEMVVAAIGHRHLFSWKDFAHDEGQVVSVTAALVDIMPVDVFVEAAHHFDGGVKALKANTPVIRLPFKGGKGKGKKGGEGDDDGDDAATAGEEKSPAGAGVELTPAPVGTASSGDAKPRLQVSVVETKGGVSAVARLTPSTSPIAAAPATVVAEWGHKESRGK